jgi:TrpR family trp operon transcriptional repressor
MNDRPRLPADLVDVLTSFRRCSDVDLVLTDLLTPSEIESIAERWEIVKRLDAGESQRDVRDAVGVSVTTVSRGSRGLKYGVGGFRIALDRLAERPAS